MKKIKGYEIEDIGCGWVVRDPQGQTVEVTEDEESATKLVKDLTD